MSVLSGAARKKLKPYQFANAKPAPDAEGKSEKGDSPAEDRAEIRPVLSGKPRPKK